MTRVGGWLKALRFVTATLWSAHPLAFLTTVMAAVIGGGASLVLLLLLRSTVSVLLDKGSNLWPVAGLVAVLGMQQLVHSVGQASQTLLRQKVTAQVNVSLLEKLQKVPYSCFEDGGFQAEFGMLVREGSYRPSVMVDAAIGVVIALLSLVGIAIGLTAVAGPLPILVVLILLPGLVVESRYGQQLLSLQTIASEDLLRMQFLSIQSMDATWQRDLRTYRSGILLDEYRRLSAKYLDRLTRAAMRLQANTLVATLIVILLVTAVVGAAVLLVWLGRLSPAAAVITLTGIYLGLGQSRSLTGGVGMLVENIGYSDRLRVFLTTESFENGRIPSQAQPTPMAPTTVASVSKVRLVDVGYKYPNSGHHALEEITCEFHPGLTGIVGANGAGKSTLLRILSGLVDPQEGTVEAVTPDGMSLPLSTAPKAVLFQNPSQLSLTVRQNITMEPGMEKGAAPEDDRVWQALTAVGLDDVVRALPRGLDTPLGMGFGGISSLSGGQWQRLALARLIYFDSPLLLLDEPAASLDPEGESALLDMFAERAASRIIVIVTHRFETVLACHRMLILSDGRIAGDGAPNELMREGASSFMKLFVSSR